MKARDRNSLLLIVMNALREIPFLTYGLKGTAGLSSYAADMRVANPLIIDILRCVLMDEYDDAMDTANNLCDWLRNRKDANWEKQ